MGDAEEETRHPRVTQSLVGNTDRSKVLPCRGGDAGLVEVCRVREHGGGALSLTQAEGKDCRRRLHMDGVLMN